MELWRLEFSASCLSFMVRFAGVSASEWLGPLVQRPFECKRCPSNRPKQENRWWIPLLSFQPAIADAYNVFALYFTRAGYASLGSTSSDQLRFSRRICDVD